VIAVVMAAPTTADKGSGARLRAGSARGMACRQPSPSGRACQVSWQWACRNARSAPGLSQGS
jgi:hypothetical protein